jgi:ATP-dependent Clp protease ATP-binding subunit ClpC
MMQFVSLYYFLEKPWAKTVRIGVFLGVIGWVLLTYTQTNSIKIPLALLLLFIVNEIFIRFKLAHIYPTTTISSSPEDMYKAATMPVLAALQIKDPTTLVFFLTDQSEIGFMMKRMLIKEGEIHPVAVDKDALFAKAVEYAQKTHTNYIDTPHLFGAYLVLAESQTKLLFSKELKEVDIMRLIVWTALSYPKRQETKQHFQVIGEGYGESLVDGWTYETRKYTLDWTTEALQNEPMMFGMNEVFQQIIGVLSQPTHNNVLLIGEAGSGKHLLIDKLAFESYNGHVPRHLQHKRVLALVVGSLLAGANDASELETRLQLVLSELSHAQVIMAMPELQDILGSGTFNKDLSGSLLPYLENGVVPVLATITAENYKRYVEHNALKDVFTPITIPQPDSETLFGMLFMAVIALERVQKLHFSYLAIVKAATLANRFDTMGVLPGSAVKLLQATGTALLVHGKDTVSADDIASYVQTTMHVPVTDPEGEEKQLLMHLEDVLHQKVIGQHEAISAISEGMRRLRVGLASTSKPISFLFLGPTGVGKTETAKALADIYYAGQTHMLRFDMSEYSGLDGIRRLLGAAPGEGDEKGELTEAVFDNPSSLILLDEFEKANPRILDLFLQVLDDGRLTDNKGKTVSFTNCIIIATSNAGSEFIRQHITQSGNSHPALDAGSSEIPGQARNDIKNKDFHQILLNHLQTNHLFKPELLNRFDEVVVFKPLDHSQVITITTMLLQALTAKLEKQDITISFDAKVIEKIANDSFDAQLGARPIQRHIQDTVEDIIARKKLDGTLTRGSKAVFVLDAAENIALS